MPLTSTSATISSPPFVRSRHLPTASSKLAVATSLPKRMCGTIPYFCAVRSRYSRISAWRENLCVHSGLGSNE